MGNNAIIDMFGIIDCELITIEKNIGKNGQEYNNIQFNYVGEEPDKCLACGKKAYGHGTRTLKLNDTPIFGLPAVISITHPRKRCLDCGWLWQPDFDYLTKDHKMTDRAMLDIAQRSIRTTFEDITNDYALTANTAKNIFVEFMETYKQNLMFKTPAFLGIDEIKIKKIGEVTVITDIEHRTLFDMLPKRNQPALTQYFNQLPNADEVLWVCSDMYRPFEKSIASSLPNARWAIDHFHVVMKANEAVDKVRRELQDSMTKKDRIQTKRGLAYTLKTRAKDLDTEEAEKIKAARKDPKTAPLAIAYDLKEDFFDIYDNNPESKDNAMKAFENWVKIIPEDEIYDKFRELANTVYNFYEQIFAYWDCPIAISNGFTECSNRIIRENNLKGRGYSFEVLRGRTLYRKANLDRLIQSDMIGPRIPEHGPVFHFDSCKEEDENPMYDSEDDSD